MDRQYTVSDLASARLDADRFSGRHPDLDSFHSTRYRAMAASFGVNVDERIEWDDDKSVLARLAEHTVDAYHELSSPFSGYLAAPLIISDIYAKYAPAINDGLRETKAAIQTLLGGVLRQLHEIPEGRTVNDDDLSRNGFNPSTPWPDEFDYF